MTDMRTDEANAEEWNRIKSLFNAALDKPAREREHFLIAATGDDTALREKIQRLIASHDDPDDYMETPPAATLHAEATDSAPSGTRIGSYRLIREIGRGGMGTVHLAARDDGEFRHQVALKLVKRGMDTDMILRRFRHERQILAELDHPNIARLLDGGTTQDGRPYFVMEYIDGDPIDVFCEREKLSLTQKLELFQTVCSAVQYAHQNLIVHRDIKPGNILVTKSGVPKLLDFGIAKLLDPASQREVTASIMSMRALTPEYASPEQVRGESITTASDVYSLGVVLYELLTGRRPYEVDSIEPTEIERAVCDTDPVLPSRAISKEDSEGDRRRLRGDLDTIVMMAMQKDARRRYATVQQLSEDIGRHLKQLPVRARRDTAGYRAARFARRNRVMVVTAAAVLLALLAGLGTTMWQARVAKTERARAERRFNEVRTLATSFLFELHDAIAPLPGSTPARGLLVKRALASLDGLARESEGDPGLQRDLAAAYEKVGRVQGNSYNSNLGDTKGALVSYRKSLEIRKKLALEHPESLDLQYDLASGYGGLADMNSAVGELADAAQNYQSAIAIRRRLQAKNPSDAANRSAMAELYNFLGDTQGQDGYPNLGDVAGALKSYRQSVKLREDLLSESPSNTDYKVGLANSLMNLGYLSNIAGDTSGAAQVTRSVDILERIVAANPNDATRRMELLSGYARLRSVLADVGRLDAAVAIDRKTIGMLAQMLESDPSNTLLRRNKGAITNWLGRDLRANGRPDLALAAHRNALSIAEQLAAADPQSSEHRQDVAFTHLLLGQTLSDLNDDRAALREFEIAAASEEKLRVAEPSNSRHADDLGLIYSGAGKILTRSGKLTEARAAVDKAVRLSEATLARNRTSVKSRVNLASTYLVAGRLDRASANPTRACQFFRQSAEILNKLRTERILSGAQSKALSEAVHEVELCDPPHDRAAP